MEPSRQPVNVRRFNDLILFRVREVLLVSSPYDHFILQEDGTLTEQVFLEYEVFSLSAAPRFTHAPNLEVASEKLEERPFDLLLVMTDLQDDEVLKLGSRVKKRHPSLPIVLLNLDQSEQSDWRSRIDPEIIDGVFVWTGDSKVLLAIIKYIEDRKNVEHDVECGNVRVIVTVEDSPRYYSVFLQVLYSKLMELSKSLYSEGQTTLYRLMYMRSRPKLLHATSFEEGMELFEKYRRNMFAVISDVRIPRAGRIDPVAGLDFVRLAREMDPHLPILLQSAEAQHREEAERLQAAFVDKNSRTLFSDVEAFLSERLGFGDFIFRMPDGRELDRARDLRGLEEKLEGLAPESLRYHAEHNHFSLWLMARSEFELAGELRPHTVDEFANTEHLRRYVIEAMRSARESVHGGIVADFKPERIERDHFSKIGRGYLGGKARSIAYLNKLLSETKWNLPELPVGLPKTIVITTDEFDKFLQINQLTDFAYSACDDDEISERFMEGRLSEELASDLRIIAMRLPGPLAVRSSSLLEDSLHQPFAGIYSTLMIPNDDPELDHRFKDLCSAVKLVYASTFQSNAKSYLTSTGRRVEEEKMAVIVQQLVGRRRGPRFYPSFAGVAQSYNYYPLGPQRAEEGVVLVGLGLGRLIVEGGRAFRFSPPHAQATPSFAAPRTFLDASQREFWALDLGPSERAAGAELEELVRTYDLKAAEDDGALLPVASVYSAGDDQIRDDLRLPGPRVITFNNILKHKAIPLAEALQRILDLTKAGLGGDSEVEFACEMGDWGQRIRRGADRIGPVLYLLQLRPLEVRIDEPGVPSGDFRRDDALCLSKRSLGHGVIRGISDVVYVRPSRWNASQNRNVAAEVGRFNSRILSEERTFLLIGPGRWGSADDCLGIPVQWGQISAARVIVEASPKGYDVDPSQGSHFFHNITSLGIGYLTLQPGASKSSGDEEFVDWEWLEAQPAVEESRHVRWVRLEEPVTVVLDGRRGCAAIGKPGAVAVSDSPA